MIDLAPSIFRLRVIIEATGCSYTDDLERIYCFLAELPQLLQMNILDSPKVVRTPYNARLDYGISGTVIWLESGAMIHTWPERNKFIDLYIESCKNYSVKNTVKLFELYFKPQAIQTIYRNGAEKWMEYIS